MSNDVTITRCKTGEEAEAHLKALHEQGYKWITGESLLRRDGFWFSNCYGSGTCYHAYGSAKIVTHSGGTVAGSVVEFSANPIPTPKTKPVLFAEWDGMRYDENSIDGSTVENIKGAITHHQRAVKEFKAKLRRHASLGKKLGWKEAK